MHAFLLISFIDTIFGKVDNLKPAFSLIWHAYLIFCQCADAKLKLYISFFRKFQTLKVHLVHNGEPCLVLSWSKMVKHDLDKVWQEL